MSNSKASAKQNKRIYLMKEMPVWKALLKMAWPAAIFMFIFGSYMFADQILSINLASKKYHSVGMIKAGDIVRMSMGAFGPINPFLSALVLLFGMGVATRVSINMGAGNLDRAKNSMKTGMMVGLSVSIVLVPILLFTIKPWMSTQMPNVGPYNFADEGYKYGMVIVIALPLSMFNQIISSTLRTEARNMQLMIPYVASVIINLILDYIFMGPMHMGIAGSAWATFTSTLFVTIVFLIIMARNKDSIIKLKNLFGFKFKIISIIGIILVGLSPFLRNLAQSTTGTIEANIIKGISSDVYTNFGPHANAIMPSMLSAGFPIFLLFFPIMFSFAQAGRPLASYNFGAKNMKRVKEVFLWTILYATVTAIFIYFLSSFILQDVLLKWLDVNDQLKPKVVTMNKIMMLSTPLFGLVIATMVLVGSTDRVWTSVIVSSLRGFIYFFPVVFAFKYIALANTGYEYTFWWFFPTIAFISSMTALVIATVVIKRLDKHPMPLEERINNIYKKLSRKNKHNKSIEKE